MASQDGNSEELRIVILGDSGSGKSATGNTILGKRAFTIRQSQDTQTLTCQTERGVFEGTPVSVVDTPMTISHNSTEMSKCISYSAPGPHAFLDVIPLDIVTDVEQHVRILHRMFGEKASRYTIFLFTRGDKLPDADSAEELISKNQLPSGVGYHIFNNRDEDPSQVRELLEKIKRMVQRNGGSYCIKVKEWKDKYLYPFASAVTIGCGIGAASGGTGGGTLMAVLGSVVGVFAGGRGNKSVAAAVVVAVVVAVAFATVMCVAVQVAGVGVITHLAALAVIGVVTAVVSPGVVLGAASVAMSVFGTETRAASAFAAGFALLSTYVAVFVSAVTVDEDGAAAMGLADAIGAGAVIGATIAAEAAGGIFTGADTAGAAFDVFDDIDVRAEMMMGIFGGAGVGAGVSAAVLAYVDRDLLNAVGAGFTAVIGVSVLIGLFLIDFATLQPRLAFAAVSAGAVFGAEAGVLGASHFAAHFAGVIITIVCKAVAMGLNRSS